MYVIWISAIVVAFFLGIFFGSRLYYQMRVKKEVKLHLADLLVQLDEVKWKLEITKLGTTERKQAMASYNIKLARISEVKWVLSYIDSPED